jgi:hypothetical protein
LSLFLSLVLPTLLDRWRASVEYIPLSLCLQTTDIDGTDEGQLYRRLYSNNLKVLLTADHFETFFEIKTECQQWGLGMEMMMCDVEEEAQID